MTLLTKLFLLALLVGACNQSSPNTLVNIAGAGEASGNDAETGMEIGRATQTFTFYKSFPFCNARVQAFTQAEADKLYAGKRISADVEDLPLADVSEMLGEELSRCMLDELGLPPNTPYHLLALGEPFPFDEVYVLNKTYVVALQDGYVFAMRSESAPTQYRGGKPSPSNATTYP